MTRFSVTPWMMSSRKGKMGRPSRCSRMGRVSLNPKVVALPMAFSFHSGIANALCARLPPEKPALHARCHAIHAGCQARAQSTPAHAGQHAV